MDKSSPINFISGDLKLDIAKGVIAGHSCVNKFGRSTNVDSGIATDIHDGANATTDLDIWVAPTAARIHQIKSTSENDDGDPGDVGARTLRIYGLTSWDTKEVYEDIVLTGTVNVPTKNAYVIIHRMKVLTKGATNINVGVITATADSDSTVTAQINAGQGQTQMAIYGIPSTQKAYMTQFYFNVLKTGATGGVDANVLYNPEPQTELTKFLVKHTTSKLSTGTNEGPAFRFNPYKKFVGPGILKMQATGSANNLDVSAGFDLILVDNN